MADFLHCNSCLRTGLSDRSVKYYLTECEKVLCNQCIGHKNAVNGSTCAKCVANECRFLELNESVRPEIKMCFTDISSSLRRLERVDSFQKTQRNQLIAKLKERNDRLINECNQQKLFNQNMDNELKSLRAQLESARSAQHRAQHTAQLTPNPFQSLFNDSDMKSDQSRADAGVSIVEDLFKTEPKKQNIQNIYNQSNRQISTNPIQESINEFILPLNSMHSSQHKSSNASIRAAAMSSMSSHHKPISPLQSIRKSKITLRPKNPMMSLRGQALESSSQQKTGLNGFDLSAMTPLTVTQNKNYPFRQSSYMSSLSGQSCNKNKSMKSTPSTACSSVMSLSSLYRNSRLN